MTEIKPVVMTQVVLTDSGRTELPISYLHEDGTPISEEEWIVGRWVDVTTHNDPVDVKRWKRMGPNGPWATA